MIRYALICDDCEEGFEAWFASSSAFDDQSAQGLLSCPKCSGTHVRKQIMAPSVRGTKARAADPEAAFGKLAAQARQHISENFDYVGDGFASEARAMYYDEIDHRPIWGETSQKERKELADEGVPAAPLPDAFAPEKPKPKTKLN